MKRKAALAAVLSLLIVTAGYGLVQAHSERSPGGSSGGWFGMGSGHMGSRGHMMDHGWDHMGRDYTRGSYGSRYGRDNAWFGERPVTIELAREIAEHNLGRNPFIEVGKLTESSEGFEVEIVTRKGGELVNRLLVERETGRVFPINE